MPTYARALSATAPSYVFRTRARDAREQDLRKNAAVNTLSKARSPRLRNMPQAREPLQKPRDKTPKNEASTL